MHQEPVGTMLGAGRGVARGRVNWCSLLLCAHTLSHMLLWHFFLQCNWILPLAILLEYIPHLPGEAERAARMQEDFKREEGGSGCSSLVMALLGVTQLPGWTPGVETARSQRNQCVHGSASQCWLAGAPPQPISSTEVQGPSLKAFGCFGRGKAGWCTSETSPAA